MGVPLRAVALDAEAVGNAAPFQDLQRRLGTIQRTRRHAADPDQEPVPLQVPKPKLVAVLDRREDLYPGDLQGEHLLWRHPRYGDGLPGNPDGVLHPGVADVPLLDPKRLGEAAQRLKGGDAALLDVNEAVLPLPSRLVCRDFLDDEIFRASLDGAAGAGDLGCQISKQCASVKPFFNRSIIPTTSLSFNWFPFLV